MTTNDALERLGDVLSHDLMNLLTVLIGHAERGLERLPPYDPARAEFEPIRAASGRVLDFARRFRALCRPDGGAAGVVDLGAFARESARFLARVLGPGVEVVAAPAPEAATALADPGALTRALLDAALGARGAIREGGRVTIAVAVRGAGADGAPAAEVRAKARPDGGLELRIVAPAALAPKAAPSPAPGASRGGGRAATVLVLEPDPIVRRLVRDVLEEEGHTVFDAADEVGAIEAFERTGGRVDLLLAALEDPRVASGGLGERLGRVRAGLGILYTTARPGGASLAAIPGADVIEKPFTPSGLADRVARALGGPQMGK